MKRVYTTGEAAGICGLSLSTVKRWIKRGALSSYRTPGGDIRILHDHLCDFMSKYEIPLQNLETDNLTLVLAVGQITLRKSVLKEIFRLWPSAQVEMPESDMAFGFALGQRRQHAVILDTGRAAGELEKHCEHIRRCSEPYGVRLGVCGELFPLTLAAIRPDMILPVGATSAEIGVFLKGLIGTEVEHPRQIA